METARHDLVHAPVTEAIPRVQETRNNTIVI